MVTGGGLVRFDAANTYTGITALEQGSTLDLAASGSAGGEVVFEGPGLLEFQPNAAPGVPIGDLGADDTIDVVG